MKFLSSVKLLIWLLAIIILVAIIGSVIPQGLSAEEYLHNYPPSLSRIILSLGLTNVFHSWYFIFILMTLTLNVLACNIKRLKLKAKSFGFIITHLSIVVILLGASLGAVFGEKGFMQIYEGEAKECFAPNGKMGCLPFRIALEDFILEKYETENVPTLTASLTDEGKTYSFPVDISVEHKVGTNSYFLKVLRYIPDFVIDATTKEAYSRSDEPRNPAILVHIKGPQGEEDRWAFARFPDMIHGRDENIKLSYQWAPVRVKEFKSKLAVIEGDKVVLKKTIEVNDPLRYKGYTFYQASYDPEENRWTGLQVVKDPGVGIIYIGFIMLMGGVVQMLGIEQFLKKKGRR